jgi:glycosyltransferase involved in cell wall biosynthesis
MEKNNQKPRLALDFRPLQTGFRGHAHRGIGSYARHIIQLVQLHDNEFDIYYLIDPDLAIPFGIPESHTIKIFKSWKAQRTGGLDPLSRNFLRPLADHQIDLVHFMCHSDASIFLRTPYIVTLHDLIPQLHDSRKYSLRARVMRSLLFWLEGRILHRASRVITVSHHSASDLRAFYDIPSEIIDVTHLAPAITLERRPEPNLPCNNGLAGIAPYFLSVGGIDENKNTDRVIQAFADLRKDHPNIYFVIAGKSENTARYKQLDALIRQLGIENAVVFTGYIPEPKLQALYSGCIALVYPSLYEGFGLPVIEAMASGAAVITSQCGSLHEIANSAALYVDPLDFRSIRSAMEIVLINQSRRKELIKAGQSNATRFSWSETVSKTIISYRNAISARN